jgi:hypothetical protein
MYANYFIIDNDFLSFVPLRDKERVADYAYAIYKECLRKGSRPLSKEDYFTSKKTRYPVLFFYCPKCQASWFFPSFGFKSAQGLKYCPHCGEPSIDHRFNEGMKKVTNLLQLSIDVSKTDPSRSKELNQCIITSLCSVYEVYLREFYADILNAKYVRQGRSLYHKFLKDCKNDFLNPGKTNDRLKKEIDVNYKNTVGTEAYKTLSLLSDYRNVIVHNNGICDAPFLKQHPDVEPHSQIKPSVGTVASFMRIVLKSVIKMNDVYEKELCNVAGTVATEYVIAKTDNSEASSKM